MKFPLVSFALLPHVLADFSYGNSVTTSVIRMETASLVSSVEETIVTIKIRLYIPMQLRSVVMKSMIIVMEKLMRYALVNKL